jgi:hypothetical protein
MDDAAPSRAHLPMRLSTHPLNGGGWLLICDVPEGRFQVEFDTDHDATVLWASGGHSGAATIRVPSAPLPTYREEHAEPLLTWPWRRRKR